MVLRSAVMAMRYLAIGRQKTESRGVRGSKPRIGRPLARLFVAREGRASLGFCPEFHGESGAPGKRRGYNCNHTERCPHEEAGGWRIRGILHQVHCQSAGYGCLEHSRIRAVAYVAVIRGTLRARRKFPLRSGQMDDK